MKYFIGFKVGPYDYYMRYFKTDRGTSFSRIKCFYFDTKQEAENMLNMSRIKQPNNIFWISSTVHEEWEAHWE